MTDKEIIEIIENCIQEINKNIDEVLDSIKEISLDN